jgi:outer membrane protein
MLVFSDLGVFSLKKNQFVVPALLLGIAVIARAQGGAPAAGPTKIGIIHVQAAILQTKDGQKAAADLKAKFAPKQAELEKKQAAIEGLREQMQRGSATMSDEAKAKIARDIDANTKSLTRDNEDLQTDVEQEEGKIFNDLGSKLYQIVEKFAKDNGYSMIIDVSSQQTPVWWAADSINITAEITSLYDKAHPGTSAAAPAQAPKPAAAAPAPKPAVAAPSTPLPSAPPKKQ